MFFKIMGFIKMLFFRKEKAKPKKVKINHSELKEQYQNLLGDLLNDFEAEASGIFREIRESRQEIAMLVEELGTAELKNQNIPPKERHFMEGNRLAYTRAVNSFLLKLDEPDEISEESIKDFLEEFEQNSKAFRKASFRPGQITSHFFGDAIKKITSSLNSIEKSQQRIAALVSSERVKELSGIRAKIGALGREIEKSDFLIKELERAETAYDDLKNERAVFEQRISRIGKNSSFAELNEMKSQMKKVDEELKILDAEFIGSFLQIEKALKKFAKSGDESFIGRYIEDPVSSVLNDPQLRIVEILGKARDALVSGALEIDEKKKEKLAEKLSSLDKETFTRFIISHNGLTLKLNELSRKIGNNNSQRELDDAKYKLEHVQQKQQNAGESIKKLNRQMEELKISELKQDIERGFEKLNVPVEIEI